MRCAPRPYDLKVYVCAAKSRECSGMLLRCSGALVHFNNRTTRSWVSSFRRATGDYSQNFCPPRFILLCGKWMKVIIWLSQSCTLKPSTRYQMRVPVVSIISMPTEVVELNVSTMNQGRLSGRSDSPQPSAHQLSTIKVLALKERV